MFKKTMISTAVTIIIATTLQTSAIADDNSSNVRDHRSNTVVRDHRDTNPPRKNETVTIKRKDCRLGYENLRRAGYENISIIECKAPQYKYMANKDDGIFRALMNAYSGKMDIKFIGFGH